MDPVPSESGWAQRVGASEQGVAALPLLLLYFFFCKLGKTKQKHKNFPQITGLT